MKYILIIISIFCFSLSSWAEKYSMRRCMLLPITDSVNNSTGFKIYENLERQIKHQKWCDYVPSSEIISVFSKYRDKLPEYLEDPSVLRTVADRLQIGTIIRVKVKYEVDKMHLALDVIGESGDDIYFSEKTVLNKIDLLAANTALSNWLELYETTIPYEGKVIGILGDQITFSFAKDRKLEVGQEFKIKKFIKKKRHPLLKKIVEWDSEVIAKGKVFNLSRSQALGVIKVYTSNKKVTTGDWIKLEEINPKQVKDEKDFPFYEKQKFGKLGDLALTFNFASTSVSTSAATGNNKMGGYTYGLSAAVETWITRNYVVLGEYSKKIGNLSKSSGSPASDTTGHNLSVLKIAGGYKYLPMGFFYGPQVNIYAGYASYSYKLDTSATDGFGENSFSGIIVGVGGNVPIKKGIRVFASGEIMPFGEFEDTSSIFGSNKSKSSMVLELGAKYLWAPNINLLASFEIINNTAKFSGSNSELSYSDSFLKAGATFSF